MAHAQNPKEKLNVKLQHLVQNHYGATEEQITPATWFTLALGLQVFQTEDDLQEQVSPLLQNLVPKMWSEVRHFSNLDLSYFFESMIGAGERPRLYPTDSRFTTLNHDYQTIFAIQGMRYLRMLKHEIGDSLYQTAVLKTFQVQDSVGGSSDKKGQEVASMHNEGLSLLDNFLYQLEHVIGRKETAMFKKILQSGTFVDVAIKKVKQKDGNAYIYMDYQGDWIYPFDIEVELKGGERFVYHHVVIDKNLPFIVDLEEKVVSVTIDPKRFLVELNKSNNRWPKLKNYKMRPFFALPSWSYYNVIVSSNLWEDWEDNNRIGLEFKGGLGADLYPLSPSFFRHNFNFEISVPFNDISQENLGYTFSYNTKIRKTAFCFLKYRYRYFKEWQSVSISSIKYLSDVHFPINKKGLYYNRFSFNVGYDKYDKHNLWGSIPETAWFSGKYEYVNLMTSRTRQTMNLQTLVGYNSDDTFFLTNGDINIRMALWKGWGGEFRLMGGVQNDSPEPYRFTTSRGWVHPMARMKSFLGQPAINSSLDQYAGLYLATGYMVKMIEFKVFTSLLSYANNGVTIADLPVSQAFGFGLEHVSLAKLGLYFPVYQSQAIDGESHFKWRVETVFEWTL